MANITKIQYKGKEIILIDFTGLQEDQMIDMAKEAESLILNEKKPRFFLLNEKRELKLFLINVTGTNFGPKFVRATIAIADNVKHLSQKSAIVGISEADAMLLGIFNATINRDMKAFNTKEEALEYLTE